MGYTGCMKWPRRALVVLIALFLPVFLVTLSLRIALSSPRLYTYGFDHYDVVDVTGIERPELVKGAKGIIAYFNSNQEPLNVRVIINGREQPLFNQREIDHMADVKGLVRGVYTWQWVSLGIVLACAAGGLAWQRRRFLRPLAWGVFGGSAITIGGLLIVGAASLVGFDRLFLEFHLLSFSNDFWQLDPLRDHLVQMFPEEFFRDATLFVAFMALSAALVLGTAAGVYLWLTRKRKAKNALVKEQSSAKSSP